jgi:mono/diheme cytochrome c family protein
MNMRKSLSFWFTVALLFAISLTLTRAAHAGDGNAAGSSKSAKAVTFSKDVAPIFYKNCVACHRPNDLAPMSLISYKDVRPWARSIKEKVVTREMPPWQADPHYGQFANDKRLSQEEINTIVAWVDGGAKKGDPKDLPPVPSFNDGWQIGTPDLVLSMQEEYTVEASGPDEYIRFVIPVNLTEMKRVKAVEIHPGNKRVVHHAVAFLQTPEMIAAAKAAGNPLNPTPLASSIFYKEGSLVRTKADAPVYDDGCHAPDGGFARGSGQEAIGPLLGFYAPGKDVDVFPAGTAKFIRPGSNIIIEMHYSKTTGKPEKDRTTIGLVFSNEASNTAMQSNGALNHFFKIPPGATNHEVTACYKFSNDALLYTLMPHMHKRGKDMKYEVVYPDGRRETLLAVKYNFSWQSMYRFKEPLLVPRGSQLIVTAHFDNSERNKWNPDPTKAVRWGDPTNDEMMIGYMDYVTKITERAVAQIDPKILDAYVGEYEFMPGRTVAIARSGDQLMAGMRGVPNTPLFPETETKFFFKVADIQLIFVKDDNGEVNELVVEQGGRTFRAKRIKKTATGENK